MPMLEDKLVPHNDREMPFVPHPTMAGVKVANRCPGTGCVPRVAGDA